MEVSQSNTTTNLEEAQLQKLRLEIRTLKQQAGWRGVFAQFATAITILATSVGIFLSLDKLRSDSQKDRTLREKELAERFDSQYRTELAHLTQSLSDDKRPVAETVLSFQNLENLIKSRPQSSETESKQQSQRVAILVVKLISSRDFEFEKSRHAEFDSTALEYYPAYSDYLVDNPDVNTYILFKYSIGLKALHDKEPKVVETIREEPTGYVVIPSYEDIVNVHRVEDFKGLVRGFKEHLRLLKESFKKSPEDTFKRREYDLENSLCLFQTATRNSHLTQTVFELDDSTFQTHWRKCSQ